jgi:hypothetical protein
LTSDNTARQSNEAKTPSSNNGTVNPDSSISKKDEVADSSPDVNDIPQSTQTSDGSSSLTIFSIVDGEVLVQKSGTQDWLAAKAGMRLDPGDRVKTSIASTVSIVFFEGSIFELQGETEIEISMLDIRENKSTMIKIKQEIGATISRVKKLVDSESVYEVETPSATVSVRGSQMIIQVASNGTTTVQNVEGAISVTAQGVEILIPEGQSGVVEAGKPPSILNKVPDGDDIPDLSGSWTVATTVIQATGICEEEIGTSTSSQIQIIQSGRNLTILRGEVENQLTGVLLESSSPPNGSRHWIVEASGSYAEDGGTTTAFYHLEVVDGSYMSGYEDWQWTGGGDSCPNGKSSVSATKI